MAKIEAVVRHCDIEDCSAMWLENEHNPMRICRICGRDICLAHMHDFRVSLPDEYEGRVLSLGRVCFECVIAVLKTSPTELCNALRLLSPHVQFPWNLSRGDRVIWIDPETDNRKTLDIKWIKFQNIGYDDCVISIVHPDGEVEVLPYELKEYQ